MKPRLTIITADTRSGDYLYTADAGRPAPEFREALRILSEPVVHKLGPNPLGISTEMLAQIAAWNKQA